MLYLRACESRLAPSILCDNYAARDVARIDYDFDRLHRRVRPAINQFGAALRGAQFDARTTDYLNGHPDTVVLHLGCGLDSRAFRVRPPEGSRWFDIDLPQVIALRGQLHSETKNYRMIASSMTDLDWLDELPARGRVLVIAEGVLMYLTPVEVTEVLQRLVDRFDTGELLADLMSKPTRRLSRLFSGGVVKWGTRDGSEITRWQPKLRMIEVSPVIAGFEKISLRPQRLLYRLQYAMPATRNFDRLFRYVF